MTSSVKYIDFEATLWNVSKRWDKLRHGIVRQKGDPRPQQSYWATYAGLHRMFISLYKAKSKEAVCTLETFYMHVNGASINKYLKQESVKTFDAHLKTLDYWGLLAFTETKENEIRTGKGTYYKTIFLDPEIFAYTQE